MCECGIQAYVHERHKLLSVVNWKIPMYTTSTSAHGLTASVNAGERLPAFIDAVRINGHEMLDRCKQTSEFSKVNFAKFQNRRHNRV